MNAQISFLDGAYNLVHIPLALYPTLLQPILRTLIPQSQNLDNSSCSAAEDNQPRSLTPEHQHRFLNISVTPMECSIVCHTSWAVNVFQPVVDKLTKNRGTQSVDSSVAISTETYIVLNVVSAGLDASGRVMELSSPLALAGIPIFFISTYYSDFILVPAKEKERVVQTLSDKGFELSEDQHHYIHGSIPGLSSTIQTNFSLAPPSNVIELQARTFDLLQTHNVTPLVDEGLELVQCSGRDLAHLAPAVASYPHHRTSQSRKGSVAEHNQPQHSWNDFIDPNLYISLVSALVSRPQFLSLTLTQDDPPSILLDKNLLGLFGDSLIGDMDAKLIPIFLDLVNLPLEVTGIVCGVAGRLVQEMQMTESSDLCYLSTARASAVILPEQHAVRARSILEPVLRSDG